MIIKRKSDIKSSEITDQKTYINRRRFLQAAGLSGAGIALSASAFSFLDSGSKKQESKKLRPVSEYKNLIKSSFNTDETLTDYSDATSYCNFYEFGTQKSDPEQHSKNFMTDPWSVAVEGECDKPGTYTLEDILKPHSLEERIYRLRCVEAWSMVIPWVGFPLADLLKRFEPNSNAKYVSFETLYDPDQMPGQKRRVIDWPYREGLRIDEAMNPLTLMAVGMYDASLPNQNGAPLRLVVPWKYGFKSIKSIVKIRFTRTQPDSSWNMLQPSEYGFYSNVNPDVNHPRWSQKRERRIGEWAKRETLPFNGYAEQVAHLYSNMDLKKYF